MFESGKGCKKDSRPRTVWGVMNCEGDQLDWKSICTWEARGKSGKSWVVEKQSYSEELGLAQV